MYVDIVISNVFNLNKHFFFLSFFLSSGTKHPGPGTTRHGGQIQEPETPTCDAYLKTKFQSTTLYHTETKPGSDHRSSRKALYISIGPGGIKQNFETRR